MNLKDNLKKIRKDNNLSQEDLAEKLGVSRQSVSKWESGVAYPEMDKVIQICNLFNLNIDDLLNQNISEVQKNNNSKVNINKYIDDFFDFITKTIKMFSSMKFKDIFKCLFEQCIIAFLIIVIFLVLGYVMLDIVNNIIYLLPENIAYPIINILSSIYTFTSIVLGIIILIHIFKTRYLNYYVIVDMEDDDNESSDDNIIVDDKKVKFEFREEPKEKIIIRDPKHSEYKFLNGILKCLLFIVKVLDAFIGLFFCFTFVMFVMAFVVSFLIAKSGLLFIGAILIIISCLIINYIVLNILYNFIINRKNKKVLIGILVLLSLFLFGTGTGLAVISLKDFNFSSEPSKENMTITQQVFEMKDDFILTYFGIKYVQSDNNDLKFIFKDSVGCKSGFTLNEYDEQFHYYRYCNEGPELFRNIIDSINNKEIYDYSYSEVELHTNSKNIEIIKKNQKEYFER